MRDPSHDVNVSRSVADCNYLVVEVKSVLQKARDVVDDDANGAHEHL